MAVNERLKSHYGADYRYVLPSEDELRSQRETCVLWEEPRISILVPAYETPEAYLRELLDSVLAQTYPVWELLLADASESSRVKETLDTWQKEHTLPEKALLRYEKLPENGGISENSNLALSYTCGDYVALLDHDDVLTPDALYEMVIRIREAAKTSIGFDSEALTLKIRQTIGSLESIEKQIDEIETVLCSLPAVKDSPLQKIKGINSIT